MFLVRGFAFTREAVREWEVHFAAVLTERLRARRRDKAGAKWHADATYVGVGGRWLSWPFTPSSTVLWHLACESARTGHTRSERPTQGALGVPGPGGQHAL
jgi:hypothetical protein